MRGRTETPTRARAERPGVAGRGWLLLVLATAIAAALAALWLLFARPSAPRGLQGPVWSENSRPSAPLELADSSAQRRSSAGTPPETDESDEPDDGPINHGRRMKLGGSSSISGRFVFEDGSTPPEMTFRMDAYAPNDPLAADCPSTFRDRTDAHGAFVVEGLCRGEFTIQPGISGLPRIEGLVQVPATRARVVLSGYLIRVRTLSRNGSPAVASNLRFRYVPTDAEDGEGRTSLWERVTDGQGESWFGLPGPGACTISAFRGLDVARTQELDLSGPSRVVDVPLDLLEKTKGAVLRVDLRSCESPEVVVQDYCIELLDPATGTRVARLDSEDQQQHRFRDLKPGSFRVRATPRYGRNPVFYRQASTPQETTLELVEGREATLRMCVDLGGRLEVTVHGDGPTRATKPNLAAIVDVRRGSEDPAIALDFRVHDELGVTVSRSVPFGQQRVTENVLEPGRYVLTARAPGYAPQGKTVFVQAGEMTSVTFRLQKP